MFQDFTKIKIKATQEKGYVLPSDDNLDASKITVDIGGETKVCNIDEVELDNDVESNPMSDNDLRNWGESLANENRAKRKLNLEDE